MANTFTTDNKAVGNNIALASSFLPIIDEVYKRSSLTSILDFANDRVRWVGAKTVSLFKTAVDGLGDYDRNKGFVTGDITSSWENMTISQDRGRSFLIDVMDNDETLGMAMGTTMNELLRTKVVPEIDSYRFAKYASGAGNSASADITVGTTDIPELISTAEQVMGDAEVPYEGRILFVSEKAYAALKAKITRYVANDDRGINTAVEYYDDMRVIRVPAARFNTAITLYDGVTSSEEAGGYTPTAGGYPINFMIVHPSAVLQVVKHVVPRIFAPEVNQSADGWLVQYRAYHDAFVEANKVNGIYLHRAATAIQ